MFTTKQNASPAWDKAPAIMSKLPPHYPVLSAAELLKGKNYEQTLAQLKNLAFVPDSIFDAFYLKAIHQYVEFVQGLPATQMDSFNYHGGLLELGLKRALQTLAWYRREYPIRYPTPEKTPVRQAIWSYALFTAGLMYGIGQIVATYWVMICDVHGHPQQRWNCVKGGMKAQGDFYRYSFETTRRDELASRSTLVLAMDILPKDGIGWIATDAEIFSAWLSILLNDEKHSGLFAKCIFPIDAELGQQPNLDAGLLIGEIIQQYELEEENQEKNARLLQDEKTKDNFKRAADDNAKQANFTKSGMFIAGKESSPIETAATNIAIDKVFISWLREKHIRQRGAGGQLLFVTPQGLLINYELVRLFSQEHAQLGSPESIFNKLQHSRLATGLAYQKTSNNLLAQTQQGSHSMLVFDLTILGRKFAEINHSLEFTMASAVFPAIESAVINTASPTPSPKR